MTTVYPMKLPSLSVRDSFDDDDLSDIDDEVFIRDGKNGILKIDEDCSVKRPLMPPRRKTRISHLPETHHLPYKTLFVPFCYVILGFIVLLGLIVLCIITASKFPIPLNVLKNWLSEEASQEYNSSHVAACTSLGTKVVWVRTLSKLTSEAPLTSNDVNGDNVEDIIVGFSTGLDKSDAMEYVCTLYFDQQAPCLGGVLALDGNTGETIWTHWTAHAVFSVDCDLDLTGDKVKDCIVAGRGGILHAVNGRDGTAIWKMSEKDPNNPSRQTFYDIYDAKYIADIDDDGIGDVVASHTQQSEGTLSEIVFISGKSGNTIHSSDIPGSEQLYASPQTLVHPDGETYLLLATNNEQKSGGLYIVPQSKFLLGDFTLQKLHHGAGKGTLLPPVLIDVNGDGTEDIVAAMFNSTIVAYDGLSFKEIWNFTIPNSEVISIPIPGYFDDDDIPDLMVKHQIGPGFPIYQYTSATVLNGKTGIPLLEKPMEDTLSAQMSGLSVTVDGFNNDWFLHWSADCLNHAGVKEKYEFFKEPNVDADLCKLRFNSTLVTSLFAFSQHVAPPGQSLYYSEDWKRTEFNNTVDARKEADLDSRPDDIITADESDAIMSNRSPKLTKSHRKSYASRNKASNSEPDNYFPKMKSKFDSSDEYRQNDFLNKALDDFSEDESWRWDDDRNKKTDDNYDDVYEEDDKILEPEQFHEIRAQRSDKPGRTINNDTNDVENQLDPSMDYTNGQSKQNSYYSSLPYNRTSNLEDSSDYVNIPDIDFVDNIKDAEALGDIRKRETENGTGVYERLKNVTQSENETSASPVTHNQTDDSWLMRSNFAQLVRNEEDANIEKVFKRESMKNLKKKQKHVSSKTTKPHSAKIRKKRASKKGTGERKPKLPYGVQRQPQTGILLPSLKPLPKRNSVDLVFSTYWLPPSRVPFVLLPRDLECIRKVEESSGKKLMNKEREAVISDCLAERNIDYDIYEEAMDKENVRIALGQMTVYRMQLECVCPDDMPPTQTCKDISPRQSWPAYLGASGNGYFQPVRPRKT